MVIQINESYDIEESSTKCEQKQLYHHGKPLSNGILLSMVGALKLVLKALND